MDWWRLLKGIGTGGLSEVPNIVGEFTGTNAQVEAAKKAAITQQDAANTSILENQRQYNESMGFSREQLANMQAQAEYAKQQGLLAQQGQQPFLNAGLVAMNQQQGLLGLNGADQQQAIMDMLANSPQMNEMAKQGEMGILQNASPTGGLRGGNTQWVLAQSRPQLLNQMIDQYYNRLGGFTGMGFNAASNIGNYGIGMGGTAMQQGQLGINAAQNAAKMGAQYAGANSDLMQQQAAAKAGGQIAQGGLARQQFGDVMGLSRLALGAYGAFGGLGGAAAGAAGAANAVGSAGAPYAPGISNAMSMGGLRTNPSLNVNMGAGLGTMPSVAPTAPYVPSTDGASGFDTSMNIGGLNAGWVPYSGYVKW